MIKNKLFILFVLYLAAIGLNYTGDCFDGEIICRTDSCSDDPQGVLNNQTVEWCSVSGATHYQIWRVSTPSQAQSEATLCQTVPAVQGSRQSFDLTTNVCNRPTIGPDGKLVTQYQVKVIACNLFLGEYRCSPWAEQLITSEFFIYTCFRQTDITQGPNETKFNTCEEPCYPGAPKVLPQERIPLCP